MTKNDPRRVALRLVLVPLVLVGLLVIPLLPPSAHQASSARLASRTEVSEASTTTTISAGDEIYNSLTLSSVATTSTTATTTPPVEQKAIVPVAPTLPPTTTTTRPAHTLVGGASWWDAGGCAMNVPPMGARVTVTNVANGKTTHCTIIDRGPHVAGRIIDLDKGSFAAIANPSSGVARVRVTW